MIYSFFFLRFILTNPKYHKILLMVQKSGDSPLEVDSSSHCLQRVFFTSKRWLLGRGILIHQQHHDVKLERWGNINFHPQTQVADLLPVVLRQEDLSISHSLNLVLKISSDAQKKLEKVPKESRCLEATAASSLV